MLIAKNGTVLNVTRGAYLSLFKDKGWKPTKGTKKDRKSTRQPNFMTPQASESKSLNENISEIPFGNMMKEPINTEVDDFEENEDYEIVFKEMTVKELVEYAEENDIDLDGATRRADIISIIEKAVEE